MSIIIGYEVPSKALTIYSYLLKTSSFKITNKSYLHQTNQNIDIIILNMQHRKILCQKYVDFMELL